MKTSSFTLSLVILALGCTAPSRNYSAQHTAPMPEPKQEATEELPDPSDADGEKVSETVADADELLPEESKDSIKVPTALDYCKGSLGIVGGTVATVSDMVTKSTVRLMIGTGFCTGTLIGPQQISTAAHCFLPNTLASSIQIQFGVNPVSNPNVRVTGYAVHPNYRDGPFQGGPPTARVYDIAVVSFSGTIPAGYGVAPVGSTVKVDVGTEVILAGYGAYSDTDMEERPLTYVRKGVAVMDRVYKEIQLQIGGQRGGCFGDSGGPSYIPSDNGLCLMTLSTTTGPGRAGDGSCNQGSGTLMDITAHQGWMRCSYEKLGVPLPYLVQDESKVACDLTQVRK